MLQPPFARCVLVVFFLLLTAQPTLAQKAKLPQSVTILGKHLALKYNVSDQEQLVAEYISPKESLEDWSLMFAVRLYKINPELSAYANSVAAGVRARKKQGDPVANAAVFESKDGRSCVVDFLISEKTVIEHNVWRYVNSPNGMLAYQIARRVDYGKDGSEAAKHLVESINEQRVGIVRELTRKDLPVPSNRR